MFFQGLLSGRKINAGASPRAILFHCHTRLLLVVVFDFFKLGINHIVGVVSLGFARLGLTSLSLLGVHFLYYRSADLGQSLNLGFDSVLVITLERFFQLAKGSFDGAFLVIADFVGVIGQHLAGGVHQLIALVAGSDQFFELAVFLGVGLGVTHHFFDFLVTQAGVGLDHDGLL